MLKKGIEVEPKTMVVGKTYRFRNAKLNEWVDITAPTPEAALEYLGWKAEDVDILKVWKCSGKIGESGRPTPGGWGKLILAGSYPSYVTTKKQREAHDKFRKQCQENEAKGLTWAGYTKSFEGQSKTFYLNGVEIIGTIDYSIASSPHLEFRSIKDKEPSVLTETGYRSHFTQTDLGQYKTLEEAVEAMVAQVMSEERKRGKKYTLTWEPSDEYLKHSPVQLSLFDKKEMSKC